MCIACEQDAMWFAYLRRKGLITPDGFLVEQPPSLAGSADQPPAQGENKEENAGKLAEKSSFSSDDPAG